MNQIIKPTKDRDFMHTVAIIGCILAAPFALTLWLIVRAVRGANALLKVLRS